MKASDALTRLLVKHRVRYCFELVGGMIAHLLDSIALDGRIEIVSMHHEQAAAFAAEGVGRASKGRELAVAMGTSGPGATNLITGIGSCWFDSVPCLFVTGQVNTNEMRDNPALRQQGFQELDIVSIVKPITKYAVQVKNAGALMPELHKALSLALSVRQGPVLLDIPNDIQRMEIPAEEVDRWIETPLDLRDKSGDSSNTSALKSLRGLCLTAHKPLVCIGGGARWAPQLNDFLNTLEACNIPYVSTLMGHESVPVGKSYFNMIGVYGCREANWAVQNCDLLLVLGARMDVRQTGADTDDFAKHAKIVQVDADAAQLNNRVKVDLPILMEAEHFIDQFKMRPELFPALDAGWLGSLTEKRCEYSLNYYPDWDMSPSVIFKLLNESLQGQPVEYVCDVGNHQMWAAHGLRLGQNQTVHYSGGMGAMGFALPAAIGVALKTKKKTIVISGDGSLQVNSHELDTINRLQQNIAIIVMNNFSLGMVKNFQDMYFEGRDQSTMRGYSCPSFVALGKAYGIKSVAVSTMDELRVAFEHMRDASEPLLIEVIMRGATECRPRLAFGSKLGD